MNLRRKILIVVLFTLVLVGVLSVFTDNNAGWEFLYDNLFWAQTLFVAGLYLILRRENGYKNTKRGLAAVLIGSICVVIIGFSLAKAGPRVVTEADHPMTITYLCDYYGDDLPLLRGHGTLCYLKNPITSASNPAWLLLDNAGFRANQRGSQVITFLVAEVLLITSFFIGYRTTKKGKNRTRDRSVPDSLEEAD